MLQTCTINPLLDCGAGNHVSFSLSTARLPFTQHSRLLLTAKEENEARSALVNLGDFLGSLDLTEGMDGQAFDGHATSMTGASALLPEKPASAPRTRNAALSRTLLRTMGKENYGLPSETNRKYELKLITFPETETTPRKTAAQSKRQRLNSIEPVSEPRFSFIQVSRVLVPSENGGDCLERYIVDESLNARKLSLLQEKKEVSPAPVCEKVQIPESENNSQWNFKDYTPNSSSPDIFSRLLQDDNARPEWPYPTAWPPSESSWAPYEADDVSYMTDDSTSPDATSFSQTKMVEYSDDHEDDDDAEFIYSSVSDDFFITNSHKCPSAQSYTFSTCVSIPTITITPPSPPSSPSPSRYTPPEPLLPVQDEQFGMLLTVPNALTSNRSLQQDIEGNWHIFNRGEWRKAVWCGAVGAKERGWLVDGGKWVRHR